MAITLKSYVGIGVPGPRGPKGDGADLGVYTPAELQALIVSVISDYIDGGVTPTPPPPGPVPPAPSPGTTYMTTGYVIDGYVV